MARACADATILLDLPIEAVNERRAHDKRDRFESADLAFHERVREGYLELAERDGWIVVDGWAQHRGRGDSD